MKNFLSYLKGERTPKCIRIFGYPFSNSSSNLPDAIASCISTGLSQSNIVYISAQGAGHREDAYHVVDFILEPGKITLESSSQIPLPMFPGLKPDSEQLFWHFRTTEIPEAAKGLAVFLREHCNMKPFPESPDIYILAEIRKQRA